MKKDEKVEKAMYHYLLCPFAGVLNGLKHAKMM